MKTALKISIILNLGLLGGLVFIWANQRGAGVVSALPAGMKAKSPMQVMAVSAPPIIQQVEQKPFHWSQLESADYRTYIKNLRGIGCPEATLRAIVTADVNAVYQKRSQELEQKLADINRSSWPVQFKSLNSRQALQAELQKLPDEEVSEIADLLGLQPAPARKVAVNTATASQANTTSLSPADANPSSQTDATPSSQVDTASLAPVDETSPPQVSDSRNDSQNTPVLPLVFQNIDPSALKLDRQQVQAINELRQNFVDAIGGPNQDPQDPAYSARWQGAQPENDNLMLGSLGIMAWETYQVEAWNGH
jgi:hypothetical protein